MKRCFSAAFLLLFAIASQAQPKPDFKRKGAPVPPFVITQLSGKMITSAVLRKGKSMVIAIFSPQCEHCAMALDTLRAMAPLLRDKQFIFVTEARNKDLLKDFLLKHGFDKEPMFKNIGWDAGDLIYSIYTYGPLPQINLYSPKGALIGTFTGHSPLDSLRIFIQ